jgi:hypothetical protein
MNSWDRDTQNALLLQNSDSPNNDYDLETSAAPKEAPPDVTVYMYHSQKPHKWNKRYITLLSSGQIYVSKKPQAKMSDKDVNNICHLSDFDIYTSTPNYTRKTLKPPKKHCYAIKSQQKTTMFISTEKFVHYFSTDDGALANKWYSAVQRWRSWYLVNRMGEGAKKSKVPKTTKIAPNHAVKLSVDEDPYTIGSFTPLMNMDRFNNPPPEGDDGYDSEEENRPLQIPFHLRNSMSLSPIPSKRLSNRHPPPVSYKLPPEAKEFSSSGLLGRTYSQRQKALKDREATQNQSQNTGGSTFISNPDVLLNRESGNNFQRTNSIKSTRRPTNAAEGGGRKPKPLLDFTPQFKEAPQWDKKGKGRGVKAVEGVPLVEVATTHEAALVTANFRPERDGNVFRRDQAVQRPKTGRERKDGQGPFVEGGLVGGVGRG